MWNNQEAEVIPFSEIEDWELGDTLSRSDSDDFENWRDCLKGCQCAECVEDREERRASRTFARERAWEERERRRFGPIPWARRAESNPEVGSDYDSSSDGENALEWKWEYTSCQKRRHERKLKKRCLCGFCTDNIHKLKNRLICTDMRVFIGTARGEWEENYMLNTEIQLSRMEYEERNIKKKNKKKIYDADDENEGEDEECGSLIWSESKKWGIKAAGARSDFFF